MDELSTNRRGFLGGVAAGSVAGKVGGLPPDALDREGEEGQAPLSLFSEPPAGLYLNVSGIEGGSASQLHRDEIDVLSFSLGMSRESDPGSGRGTSAARFDPLVVTKGIDKATPQLMEWFATGAQRSEAVLSLTRVIGGSETDVYVVRLENAQAVSLSDGGGIEAVPTEEVALTYDRIEVTYREQDETGSISQEWTFGWDIREKKQI